MHAVQSHIPDKEVRVRTEYRGDGRSTKHITHDTSGHESCYDCVHN
jgi:hypothetical protein